MTVYTSSFFTSDRLRRAPTWAITVNNIAFMAVPRSIPACFAATGWGVGLAALGYSCLVTYDTGLVRLNKCPIICSIF